MSQHQEIRQNRDVDARLRTLLERDNPDQLTAYELLRVITDDNYDPADPTGEAAAEAAERRLDEADREELARHRAAEVAARARAEDPDAEPVAYPQVMPENIE